MKRSATMCRRVLVTVAWLLPLPAFLQGEEVRTDPSPEAATVPPPSEGLWPSPKLMNALLGRWADSVSEEFKLDEAQRGQVREAATRRWSEFFTNHRAIIQPIANDFLELRMELEPPAKEDVQAWAKRAAPVFDEFRNQFAEAQNDFRKVLHPMQRARFELEALQFGAGLQFAEQRMKRWESGEFDPMEFWEPTRSHPEARKERWAERRERREERRRHWAERESQANADDAPETDQIALELTSWEKYVAEFIRSYDLDEGQRTAALSCLQEMKERATAHRERRREDILELEKRIRANSGVPEELERIKKLLVELYGPVDEMFKELQKRMEAIPTALQRANAPQRARDESKRHEIPREIPTAGTDQKSP